MMTTAFDRSRNGSAIRKPGFWRRCAGTGFLFAAGLCLGLAATALWSAAVPHVEANVPGRPTLHTNQELIEELLKPARIDIDDPLSVFAFVVEGLPDRVKVYPTENYYYFNFVYGGVRYMGNLRLDVSDRDSGHVHFAYFRDYTEWQVAEDARYRRLNGKDGVRIEKLAPLGYRLSYRGKDIVFELNDLKGVEPPRSIMHADETYLGPIFDESGMQFFLLYNTRLKIFHYVLNETERADEFFTSDFTDRIVIGSRTGFAFYRDKKLPRKILIGVFEGNARTNNYLDGPFDQLPDNFLEGDKLRQAIIDSEPSLKGEVDRLGNSPDGSDRFYIGPYRHYRTEEDLRVFHDCVENKEIPEGNYYECFVFEEGDTSEENASAAQ